MRERSIKKINWKGTASIARAIEAVSEYLGLMCSVSILVAAIVIVHEVVVRYVLRIPTIWQIEFSIYMLLMATFVGAAYGQKHEGHIHVDFIISRLSPKVSTIVVIVVSAIGFVVCVLIARYSWPMWWEAVVKWEHSESLWSPPLIWPYILLPLGMTLLALEYIVYIGKRIVLLRKPSESIKAEEQ